MAVVLYQQAKANMLKTKAMDADVEGHTPSPTGPQPGVFPGLGWKDNFNAIGTHHFVVIPDGIEDRVRNITHSKNPKPKFSQSRP